MEAESDQIIHHANGEIVATDVTVEDYLAHYAEQHCEYVHGVVVKLSPIKDVHFFITDYLRSLLKAYFALRPIGEYRLDPFVMRLTDGIWREPDIQVILGDNRANLKSTYMDGAADICVEVVLPSSNKRDRGDKFDEYEQYGVAEYWIIDPERQEALFYSLAETGKYQRHDPDQSGMYQIPRLPDLKLHIPTLWNAPLPDLISIVDAVRKMLA